MYTCTKGDICKKKSHRNLKLSETKMCNKNIKYSIFDSVYTKRTYQKERNETAIPSPVIHYGETKMTNQL